MSKEHNTRDRQLNRRAVLKTGVMAAGAAALTSLGACGALQTPAAGKTKPTKNMQLSLCAYSMRDALTKGEMDLFGFIDWCAELDLPGTELTSYYFREDINKSYLHQLKHHAFKNGVTVSGTAVGNKFCLPPCPERDKEIEKVKKWIDYAAEFGAPNIRIFAGEVPEGTDKDKVIIWVADAIKSTLDYAAERGVVLGLENHGGITSRAADLLAICDAVGNHPWFGINMDTGNFRTDAYEELAIIAPRAVNVHIKVEIVQNDGKKVLADLARLRDILVAVNYKGWIALEYEAEADPRTAIPQHMKQLRELFLG